MDNSNSIGGVDIKLQLAGLRNFHSSAMKLELKKDASSRRMRVQGGCKYFGLAVRMDNGQRRRDL